MNLDVNSPVEIYNEEDFGEYCGFDIFSKGKKVLTSSVSHFLAKNTQKKNLYYMHKK